MVIAKAEALCYSGLEIEQLTTMQVTTHEHKKNI